MPHTEAANSYPVDADPKTGQPLPAYRHAAPLADAARAAREAAPLGGCAVSAVPATVPPPLYNGIDAIAGGQYQLVLADPPWHYYGDAYKMGAAGKHYRLLTLDQLGRFPMRWIMAERSALFLWATGPKLHHAIELIHRWKLHYRGVAYIWIKTRLSDGQPIGPRGVPPTFVKPTTEFVLVATTQPHGRAWPLEDYAQYQLLYGPVRNHSEKPPELYARLERLGGKDLKRIELFARNRREGWDAWGDEVNNEDGTTA